MPASVAPVVIWACVVAFILCLAGAVLVLFELWTPRSRATRKWLLSGVLFSAVGAVGSFAAAQFGGSPPPQPDSNQNGAAKLAVAPPAPRPRPPVVPDSAPSSETRETPADTLPAAVREWAEVLGPRPGFETAMRAAYPNCVASLSGQNEASVPSEAAAACRRQLAQFHTEWILPVYNRKAPYEQNLELQERALRPRNLEPEILPRYSYVLAEMARLQGEQWDRFVTLDRQVADDSAACLRRRCRRPA